MFGRNRPDPKQFWAPEKKAMRGRQGKVGCPDQLVLKHSTSKWPNTDGL